MRTNPAFVVLAILLPATGCVGERPPDAIRLAFDPCAPVVVDATGATDEQRASVAEAVALWRARGAPGLTTDATPGAPRLPVVYQDAASAFHGYYDDLDGVVYLNNDLTGDARTIIAAHELGHALGLLHVDVEERPSVMNRHNRTIAPTEGDQAALVALWGACAEVAPPRTD